MFYEKRFVIPEYIADDEEHLDEQWADIGEGYYVSDYGRIWSSKSEQFLKPKRMDKYGHVGLCRTIAGKHKYEYLHRLVAEEFLDNPNNYPVVRHLDGDPTNNAIDNLAWGTQQDNMRDSIESGYSHFLTDEEREIGFEKTRVPIISINLKSGEKLHHRSINDAARDLGLWSANIQKVLYGDRKHTGGYYFEKE